MVHTGPINVALDLCHLFQHEGHEVKVFYFDDKGKAPDDIPSQRIKWTSNLDWSDYDVVHSHGIRPDLYVRKNRRRMPATVSTLHNYVTQDLYYRYGKRKARLYTNLWSYACAKHDKNVVLSEDMLRYYKQFWRNKSLEVIPNTRVVKGEIDEEAIQEIRDLAPGSKILGSVSTITTIKGLDQVIKLLKYKTDWHYVHIGDGEMQDIIDLMSSNGVTNRCHFLGFKKDAWKYVRAFDVFTLPSRTEGFPLVLIEAAQMGMPIVASDIPVISESFRPNELYTFPLDDINAYGEALDRAYDNREDLGSHARRAFDTRYAPRIVSERYIHLYESLQ
jgi:glycosyltransferase involved in cell wall biosynthesis